MARSLHRKQRAGEVQRLFESPFAVNFWLDGEAHFRSPACMTNLMT